MSQILIIEDDPNISSALSIRLQAAGYEVLAAPDGLRGLKLARNHWPDLILVDVGLPLLDIRMPLGVGYSVARRLKAIGRGDIPVIIITASKEKGVREGARQVGAVAFFEKPYDPEELLHTIDQVLHAQICHETGTGTARRSLEHEVGTARCLHQNQAGEEQPDYVCKQELPR